MVALALRAFDGSASVVGLADVAQAERSSSFTPDLVFGSVMPQSSTTMTLPSAARSESALRSARRIIFLGVRCE